MRCFWFLIFLLLVSFAQAQKFKPIEKEEVTAWLNQKSDCPEDAELYYWRFDHSDFKHDGYEDAVVVASTCMTGTAGPDVHSVISRDSAGKLIELKIAEVDRKTYDNMFGNRNSDLTVEGGLLVSTFTDDVDRETPLIIKYKWNGKEFAVVSIKKTGIFRTSYDCTGDLGEVENAICHVEELADLDLELSRVYKALVGKLSVPERNALKSEQRQWIAARDKDCTPYKGWVFCISDSYTARIEELKKRSR